MSDKITDPIRELATAVVHHAMLDANQGQKGAAKWLVSDQAYNWLDVVNLDVDFVKSWVENGCPLASTKALPRYRRNYDMDLEGGLEEYSKENTQISYYDKQSEYWVPER
jgi:hypothetical protein